MVFWLGHVFLAMSQYNTEQQYNFNIAATMNILPKVDVNIHIAPKQFTSIEELTNYFTVNVNYLMRGASTSVDEKSYFHQFNYIHPYFQLIKV